MKDEWMESNWVEDHVRSQILPPQMPINEQVQGFLGSLYPMARPYFSPLNPVFISTLLEPSHLNQKSTWQVRDGIIPTLWFLTLVQPHTLKTCLYLPYQMAPMVPTPWQKKVKYYQIESSKTSAELKTSAKGLLLTGILSGACFTREEVTVALAKVRKLLSAFKNKAMPIRLYFPFRYNALGENDESLHGQAMFEVYKGFGGNVEFVDFQGLECMRSMDGWLFHDLNTGWYIQDSYLTHLCLSRGARQLEPQRKTKPATAAIELSTFHQLQVFESVQEIRALGLYDSALIAQYAKLTSSFSNSIRFKNVWPEWFQRLVRSEYGAQNPALGAN